MVIKFNLLNIDNKGIEINCQAKNFFYHYHKTCGKLFYKKVFCIFLGFKQGKTFENRAFFLSVKEKWLGDIQ